MPIVKCTPLVDGKTNIEKWACEPCVRGHRFKKCAHFDREMRRVRWAGRRPSDGHCQYCGTLPDGDGILHCHCEFDACQMRPDHNHRPEPNFKQHIWGIKVQQWSPFDLQPTATTAQPMTHALPLRTRESWDSFDQAVPARPAVPAAPAAIQSSAQAIPAPPAEVISLISPSPSPPVPPTTAQDAMTDEELVANIFGPVTNEIQRATASAEPFFFDPNQSVDLSPIIAYNQQATQARLGSDAQVASSFDFNVSPDQPHMSCNIGNYQPVTANPALIFNMDPGLIQPDLSLDIDNGQPATFDPAALSYDPQEFEIGSFGTPASEVFSDLDAADDQLSQSDMPATPVDSDVAATPVFFGKEWDMGFADRENPFFDDLVNWDGTEGD